MAMFMVKPWYKKDDFDPDACFDANNTATEENFIKLLEHRVYDSKYIGYFVTLSNTYDYNGGKWVIADVNHDSTNTGQTNCYDLISEDCITHMAFNSNASSGDYTTGRNWRVSNVRTYLNDTFYGGFSLVFKNHIINPKYNSQGTWYNDDKIIAPSVTELNTSVGNGSGNYYQVEGVVYPLFTSTSSRIKNYDNSAQVWWSRSRNTVGSGWDVWLVNEIGEIWLDNHTYDKYIVPLLRVS